MKEYSYTLVMKKKTILILVSIFIVFPILLGVLGSMMQGSESEESSSAAIQTCQSASEEDLSNINAGMISSKYSVESGFIADFNAEDIEAIRQVFPTYTSPKVFAANIPGKDGKSVLGLWGIQKFDYGWRITALNKQTMEYSNLGADITESSATGRVNATMLELSVNTNAISCLQD
jgi:hypothetical protein